MKEIDDAVKLIETFAARIRAAADEDLGEKPSEEKIANRNKARIFLHGSALPNAIGALNGLKAAASREL